jgi:hypothetical protein
LERIVKLRTSLIINNKAIAFLSLKIDSITDICFISIKDARCCEKRLIYCNVLSIITH